MQMMQERRPLSCGGATAHRSKETLTLSLSLSLSLPLPPSPSLALPRPLSPSPSVRPSLARSLARSLALSLSLSLSLSLPCFLQPWCARTSFRYTPNRIASSHNPTGEPVRWKHWLARPASGIDPLKQHRCTGPVTPLRREPPTT